MAVREFPALEVALDGGDDASISRAVAVEQPVAFEINGLAYAVMMASPCDLEDFAVGFAMSEALAASPEEIGQLDVAEVEGGHIVRLSIPSLGDELSERIRLRLTEGSCGLCGIRSIEEVLRPLDTLAPAKPLSRTALKGALARLRGHQPMGTTTGAMHVAAACSRDGEILLAREDVGRHNALDKLVGAMARQGLSPGDGFFLLSARCSYELVEKTVRAGCTTLVTVSAPTSLAIERAEESGLQLYALARDDSTLLLHSPGNDARIGDAPPRAEGN